MELFDFNISAFSFEDEKEKTYDTKHCMKSLFPPNYDERRVFFILIYVILFIIGGIGNVTVLIRLMVKKFRNSSVKLLMIHLSIADMIVIFILIPLEIIWAITLEWPTNEFGCKLLQALRSFGHYLSSMVLICISLDRYFVLTKPLVYTRNNTKKMIAISWLLSFIFSIPQ
ncbi:G protein-coupled receptor-like protein, partial [Dinothrombium tinctorium]